MIYSFIKTTAIKIGSSITISLIFIPLAGAADYMNYPSQTYQDPPAFKWEGVYIGVHGGLASPRANPLASGKGYIGGIQTGYNFQAGPAVLGAEIEGTYLGDIKVRTESGRIEERMRGSAKARAGLSFDRSLLYGTAGITMTKFADGNENKVSSGWKQGYLLGGGIERAFAGGISAKIEYNYVTTKGVKTSNISGTDKSDIHDHIFKAGLNYRF